MRHSLQKPVLFLLASTLFLACSSLVGLALGEWRCQSAAAALERAFAAARAGDATETVRVVMETRAGGTDLVVRSDRRGELGRQRMDRRVTLAMPGEPTEFRGGRVLGNPSAWLCLNLATESVWAVKPEGGVEGGSRLADLPWRAR